MEKDQLDKNIQMEVLINAIDKDNIIDEDTDDDIYDDGDDDDDSIDINTKELLKLEKEANENEVDNQMTFGVLNYKNRPNWCPNTQQDSNSITETLYQIKKGGNNENFYEEEEEEDDDDDEDDDQPNKKAKVLFPSSDDSVDDDIWLQLDDTNSNSVENNNISMIDKNIDSIDDVAWLELDSNVDSITSISNSISDKNNTSISNKNNDSISDKNNDSISNKNNDSISDEAWLALDITKSNTSDKNDTTISDKNNDSISDEAWLAIPFEDDNNGNYKGSSMRDTDEYNASRVNKDNHNNQDENKDNNEALADTSISFLESYKIEDSVLNDILNTYSLQDGDVLNSSHLVIDDSPHRYGYNNQVKSPVLESNKGNIPPSSSSTTAHNKILFAEDVINVNDKGFGWRNIKNTSHCREFLQLITFCRCFSFEFIYKKAPLSFQLNDYSNVKLANNNNNLNSFQTETLDRWSNVVAWSCPVVSSSVFHGVTTATKLDSDVFSDKTKLNNPQVLIGMNCL
jgi:hypothetical protein